MLYVTHVLRNINLCMLHLIFLHLKKSNSADGIVNVTNGGKECFLYRILAQLYPDRNRHNKVSHLKGFKNNLNLDGIKYSVKIADFSKFENLNQIFLSMSLATRLTKSTL